MHCAVQCSVSLSWINQRSGFYRARCRYTSDIRVRETEREMDRPCRIRRKNRRARWGQTRGERETLKNIARHPLKAFVKIRRMQGRIIIRLRRTGNELKRRRGCGGVASGAVMSKNRSRAPSFLIVAKLQSPREQCDDPRTMIDQAVRNRVFAGERVLVVAVVAHDGRSERPYSTIRVCKYTTMSRYYCANVILIDIYGVCELNTTRLDTVIFCLHDRTYMVRYEVGRVHVRRTVRSKSYGEKQFGAFSSLWRLLF